MITVLLQLSDHKDLPRNICNNCLNQLESAFEFRKKCEQSEITLKRMLLEKSQNLVITERLDRIETNIYICHVCKKEYDKEEALMAHLGLHSRKKSFLCNYCGRSFTRSDELSRHTLIHSNERPFKCKTCKKAFRQKFHLTEHERSHNNSPEFVCDTCGKSRKSSKIILNNSSPFSSVL